jgi:hypothetical protein
MLRWPTTKMELDGVAPRLVSQPSGIDVALVEQERRSNLRNGPTT